MAIELEGIRARVEQWVAQRAAAIGMARQQAAQRLESLNSQSHLRNMAKPPRLTSDVRTMKADEPGDCS